MPSLESPRFSQYIEETEIGNDAAPFPFLEWTLEAGRLNPNYTPAQHAENYIRVYGIPPRDEILSYDDFSQKMAPANPDTTPEELDRDYT